MKKEDFSDKVGQLLEVNPKRIMQKIVPEETVADKVKKVRKGKQVSFEIDENLLKQLKMRALEEGLNFKRIMTAAIQEYLK